MKREADPDQYFYMTYNYTWIGLYLYEYDSIVYLGIVLLIIVLHVSWCFHITVICSEWSEIIPAVWKTETCTPVSVIVYNDNIMLCTIQT